MKHHKWVFKYNSGIPDYWSRSENRWICVRCKSAAGTYSFQKPDKLMLKQYDISLDCSIQKVRQVCDL